MWKELQNKELSETKKTHTHTHTHSSIKVISPHMDQTWKVKIDLWICFGPKNVSLLGGFNPSEKYERQFWVSSSPILGMKKTWNHHLELESWKNPIEIPPPSPQRKIIILEWHPERKTARSFMKFLPAFLRKTQEIVFKSHLPPFPLPTDSSPCKTVWDGLKICVFPKNNFNVYPYLVQSGCFPQLFSWKIYTM